MVGFVEVRRRQAMRFSDVENALAQAFLAGEAHDAEALAERGAVTLGRRWRWLHTLAARYANEFGSKTRPRFRDAGLFLRSDAGFLRACRKYRDEIGVVKIVNAPPLMYPANAAVEWEVPAIETTRDLAEWLSVDANELDWFGGLEKYARKRPVRFEHYHYRTLAKSDGSLRLIEVPKPRLKMLQRKVLTGILEGIPGHAAAHGFVKGRSIQTFAAPHVGQRVVLKMDLSDFFPSISAARVQALFRTAGYPEPVADILGGICTNSVPGGVFRVGAVEEIQYARNLYCRSHLPQGAPTSPALANLCAYRMDCRLHGLASALGATYTRYADDLAFSGGEAFERCAERLSPYAAMIAHEEGFRVHHRKTRVMRSSVRQHLTGLVVNERLNVRRADFDHLKAILTNCLRHGAQSQNREQHPDFRSHLEGRVAFVESVHQEKGAKLRAILERIEN